MSRALAPKREGEGEEEKKDEDKEEEYHACLRPHLRIAHPWSNLGTTFAQSAFRPKSSTVLTAKPLLSKECLLSVVAMANPMAPPDTAGAPSTPASSTASVLGPSRALQPERLILPLTHSNGGKSARLPVARHFPMSTQHATFTL